MSPALRSVFRSFCLLACGLALAATGLPTAADSTKIEVGVTVRKVARLQVLSQPASVSVSEADVARGYVDVAAPLRVAVDSNSPSGYLLVFAGQGDIVRQARVQGLAGEVQFDASGGAVAQRPAGRGRTRQDLEMRFRIILAGGARQGDYPWPLQVSVEPL